LVNMVARRREKEISSDRAQFELKFSACLLHSLDRYPN
jgi:hypothetical protein